MAITCLCTKRNRCQHSSGLRKRERESRARLASAGLMQEWLDAEVPLLSKTGCLAQSLRGACAELARFWREKTCMILPGLVAAKIELHMAMPHMSGTAGSMMRDRLVRRGLLPGKLQPDSCKQSWRHEAHASYAILNFKSILRAYVPS